MLTSEEKKQYNRHLILDKIGTEGQLKLKKSKVLIIGAGGLGCPILQYLTAAGIGTIAIVDDDTVDQTNLQRQILYTHCDIGKFKAQVAAERLSGLNPFVKFKIHTERFSSKNALSLFTPYDIVIDASDNFPTRYLANDAAILTDKPLVFGSIFKFEGQVSVFNYRNGPTYRCLFPSPPAPNASSNCSDIGVLGVLPGIVGSLQANEVIKMICGIGEILSGKLLTYDALTMQQQIFAFKKNKSIKINRLNNDCSSSCAQQNEYVEITMVELKNRKAAYNLLDVRTYLERKQNDIGGLHIPLNELERRHMEIPPSTDLIVYCKAGTRSKRAIDLLKEKAVTNSLINLKGGIN